MAYRPAMRRGHQQPSSTTFTASSNQVCAFCLKNREPASVYQGHQVKGRDGRVTCPQLRKHRCELCGATGEEAHTRSYCPTVRQLRDQQQQRQQQQQQQQLQHQQQQSSSSSTSCSPDEEQQQQGFSLRLGSDQRFRNMSSVTTTKYNSAGRVRNQRNHHQHHF